MSEVVLSARGIKKSFRVPGGKLEILRGIDIELKRGERIGVFGPSGSGKTTLLYILGSLDLPDEGEVIIEGTRVGLLDDDSLSLLRRQKIGFVFQFFNLIPELTVLENVMLPLVLLGEDQKSAREKSIAILGELGLEDRVSHRPDELSGGEQQRVAIARAIVKNPSILLADEPTGNLDRENAIKIMELFNKLVGEMNLALIVVSHNTSLKDYFDRAFELKDGVLSDAPTSW